MTGIQALQSVQFVPPKAGGSNFRPLNASYPGFVWITGVCFMV
jgi:hypothetical protein